MKIETEAEVNVTHLDKRGPLEFVELRPEAPEVLSVTLSTSLKLFNGAERAKLTVEKTGQHVKVTIETVEGTPPGSIKSE